ncbi:DUF5776 domain-containing protein [Levilactobacillus tongjiangensis]|uniref:DUF5776 domain-containing protein n=1 Tax=Levilactobacillus tongjiangensis TaxID=2486023 RepID=A0ABW1SSM8_9LACO|nr:DUF5776 domain-containing protein [Levilactobacillus tongjiangensis]
MNRKATLLLLSITLGVAQPISGLVMGHQPTAVTAQAATVKADNLTGTYGDVTWYLTPSGELHLGAGTLPEADLTNISVGQFARVIAAAEGNSDPTTNEAQAVADQVTKVVFDGPVKAPKDATGLFGQLRNVTDYVNLDKLNTSDTTTMSRMFCDTTWKSVTTTIDVSHFDTSKVTDMSFMFQGQGQVTALDVRNFDTSSLVNATSAFWGTKSIKELNFANGTFANFKSSSYMLTNSGVEKVNLPKFSPVANFSGYYMFYGTSTIRQITFGPQTAFIDNANTALDDAPTDSDDYTGKWQAVGSGTAQNPLGDHFDTGKAIVAQYTTADRPTSLETYVWEPVNRVIEPTTPPIVPPTEQAQPVTVQYLDQNQRKLADNQVLTGELGASYSANQLAFNGYKLAKVTGQATGAYTTQAQTVTFHYVPDLSTGGDGASVAPISSVVYATKKIGVYSSKNFSKKTLKHWYSKQKRVNRPMFVVKGMATSKNGNLRYKVKDVNHRSKTAGTTGYITAKKAFVSSVYYQTKQKKVRVINAKGVNRYQQKSLKTKNGHYRKGQVLKIKKIVAYNKTTRFQLTNGKYVTANKKLVMVTP